MSETKQEEPDPEAIALHTMGGGTCLKRRVIRQTKQQNRQCHHSGMYYNFHVKKLTKDGPL